MLREHAAVLVRTGCLWWWGRRQTAIDLSVRRTALRGSRLDGLPDTPRLCVSAACPGKEYDGGPREETWVTTPSTWRLDTGPRSGRAGHLLCSRRHREPFLDLALLSASPPTAEEPEAHTLCSC